MDFNFVTKIETCYSFIEQNQEFLRFVYYSHIPTTIVTLIIGFFVFFNNKKLLVNRLLLGIAIVFSLWTSFDLIIWIFYDSRLIMFSWALLGILNVLLFVLSAYFFYVFIEKRDVSLKNKLMFGFLILPVLLLTPTFFNLSDFDITNCQATEGLYFTNYYYAVGFFVALFVFILGLLKYRKAGSVSKRQIMSLTIGVELFLVSFFVTGFLNSYFVSVGFIDDAVSFKLEQYGLFGMTFFMGMLAYMIVRFKAFNIKLIGAQALVISLIILIASQFAFIQIPINRVLNLVALVLITGFGYILIRSVKREVAQREALAVANEEISERKEQLQKISDHLSIANDKLKELDTAKTEFVSIVAHQLQGPPTTVKGYSMLLSDGSYGEMSAEQKDVLQKIFNANEQQIEFVNDLLNVSRMESGRVNFVFEKCNIENICKEVIDNVFVKAKNKGLYLEYGKSIGSIPEVNIDKSKIKEAVANLVDNAVKYTKKGGVSVSVKECDGIAEKCLIGNHLRITVSDTGIGVPKSEMAHLFSKFSRGKDVKRLNAGGTGLGLYVAKMIIEGNHGHVWIESEGDGKGSKFIVELPVA
ncbi:MAG: PAS/PAC sensor signal transduction histidine kinase [uncultured bacterium]|nr:MAG: PAS/PAC sensor signal transduction histidine kinase [uncultured bacterium]KKP67287.1 MAG: PAS/PAC sensor signal transduction histidine kinase [Candidatus Moranbacteria bacterium GW2011_GWE1_35_17]KKP83320.1 MAG: PAS/PAC sensor signal transduction histidine kinase [Candidatus Moranbacteria bacterium GW2011_GWF1_35_5]KKP84712.1 MAG: PAS/PAC sensor signal transduction histidine kinase [Candidatus Moranbacteria bacterium GW2011_GWF2_35_54]HBR79311.1 hypothetical protein [Candidatus Moranbac